MSKVNWREQFEVLISEAEEYHAAHAKITSHDPEVCNGIHGNEWSCLRMEQALALCRQVLAKHP